MTEVVSGPLWAARNWSADEGAGSIHDDATAERLGFRGGTVTSEVDYIHPNRKMPITIKGPPRPYHSLRRRPIRKGDSRL